VFQIRDSLFVELVDEQLGTSIVPILEGGQYPSLLAELAVSSVNLERSFTNFPNPFNPALGEVTTIGFVLDDQADIDLSVFSITGEKIRDIVRRAPRAVGPHQIDTWDGFNGAGEPVAPGTYYCRITAHYASGRTEHVKRKVAVVR